MQLFVEHPGLWFVAATLLPLVSVLLLLLAGFLRNALRASKNSPGLGATLFQLLGGEVTGRGPAYVATAAIGLAFVCSTIGFATFLREHAGEHEEASAGKHKDEHGDKDKDGHAKKDKPAAKPEKGADKHAKDKGAKPAHAEDHPQEDHGSHWAGSFTWAEITPRKSSPDAERAATLKVGYFIDSLSAIMFVMVTFVATLIHLFSIGYMSDELQTTVEDHEVHAEHGHFHRRGRFGRFFMFLSLFCFSMLNLILADNLFQVFVSWELVGVCSYLLIGFYYERTSAGNAANKAFITNRVGDAGFIIGLLILWTYVGTLNFQDLFQRLRCPETVPHGWQIVRADMAESVSDGKYTDTNEVNLKVKKASESGAYALIFPRQTDMFGATFERAEKGVRITHLVADGPAATANPPLSVGDVITEIKLHEHDAPKESKEKPEKPKWQKIESVEALQKVLAGEKSGEVLGVKVQSGKEPKESDVTLKVTLPEADKTIKAAQYPKAGGYGYMPYWMLVVAGLGIFLGCVGKSAQFPLQVWLPDAMEGPTPVSALIHAATMVAAGVYLVGRCYPLFTYEVTLTIAYTGAITLFVAATIAVVMTDIKKVLAYSTVSQLGFMMLALGVGGWVAGLFHLITHAFFKALLFLGSGSVIYGCHHQQDMMKMGGLFSKMKITALTMLMGVFAIAGVPLFSGWYSKDGVLASALGFVQVHNEHFLLFLLPLITAGLTTYYMFRMWFLTFTGKPRDQHVHDHAHESPWTMTVPLIALAILSVAAGWGWPVWDPEASWLEHQIHHAEPSAVKGETGGYSYTNSGRKIDGPSPGPEYPPLERSVRGQTIENHAIAGLITLGMVILGLSFAFMIYYRNVMDPADAVEQFPGVYRFLQSKWCFDELYSALLVRPALAVAGWARWFDAHVIDGVLHAAAQITVVLSWLSGLNDRNVVDGLANLIASVCQGVGRWLHGWQTGYIRNYVLFLVLAALGMWIVLKLIAPVVAG